MVINTGLLPFVPGNAAILSKSGLRPTITWQMSDSVKECAIEGMDAAAGKAEPAWKWTQQDLDEEANGIENTGRFIRAGIRFLRDCGFRVSGIAVDCGSGKGVGAVVLSQDPQFETIYAVEYSQMHVECIMPRVFQTYAAGLPAIQRVIGDFNRMHLPDASVDLILDVQSFHHSEDLAQSFAEAYRVLRRGGALVMIERAHSNRATDATLQALLAKEISAQQKERYGIARDAPFTRRQWGEHEYRVCDWERAIAAAGFDLKLALRTSKTKIKRLDRWLHHSWIVEMGINLGRFLRRVRWPGSGQTLILAVKPFPYR